MPRWLLSAALLAPCLGLAAQAAMSDHVVAYRIAAQLDPVRKTVTGHETLTWHNESSDRVGELRFHLYLNAFENQKSTFLRESGGQMRGDVMAKNGWGWIEVRRMQQAGGPDLTHAIRFIHPDDDNADDQTVISVPLPQPVLPGSSITLDIDFVSKLPKVFARTGYHNDFYMVGQWFPKIGVYEKAGDRYAKVGAWNCHQFHATSEFYADYGVYDVSLTVPSHYIVGATGVEQSATVDQAHHLTTHRFYQEDVHDFSWTASPHFIRMERRFDPDRMVTPADTAAASQLLGLPPSELRLTPTRMILLIQPEHRWQAERHFRALENALKWWGLWYGPYPYQTITVVDPPYGAGGAGGMEYPTLITAGTNWWPGRHEYGLEGVIIHEFGHQYWYGMVGTNEFEESWLDEGFNTYSTDKIVDMVYGAGYLPIHLLGVPVSEWLGLPRIYLGQADRLVYLQFGKHDPVVRNAWQYYDTLQYGINSYMRPGTLLRTMENYLGPHMMARIMRTWFERYRFHHPDSVDFEKLVNEVSGRDMTWFFDQFVFGTNWLNYQVGSVSCDRIKVKLGSYVEGGQRVTVTQKDADRIEKERKKKGEKPLYRIVVKLDREGECIFPVHMKMTLENGQVVREQWDGRERWVKYEYTKPSKVKAVDIDPQQKILLDGSFADNSYQAIPAALPFVKWFANLLFWFQMVLP
jgi:Peptidase family M1 domain